MVPISSLQSTWISPVGAEFVADIGSYLHVKWQANVHEECIGVYKDMLIGRVL